LKRLDLAIESDLANVSLLAVAVNRVCLHLGLENLMAGHVELCVAEAATNSICHAYHGSHGHTVNVTLIAHPDRLLIEVADTGTPMPIEHQRRLADGSKDPELPSADRHSLPEGGRGLQIIRELMDQATYTCEQNLNRLVMTKRIPLAGKQI